MNAAGIFLGPIQACVQLALVCQLPVFHTQQKPHKSPCNTRSCFLRLFACSWCLLGELVNGCHTLFGEDQLQELEDSNRGETLTWRWPCGWSEKLNTWVAMHVRMTHKLDKTRTNAHVDVAGSGVRTVQCLPRNHGCYHWRSRHTLSRYQIQSTFMNFQLRVQILILSSNCINSSSSCMHTLAPRKHDIQRDIYTTRQSQ